MVRFQMYVTREQHQFLKRLSQEKGIYGGYAMRKGLALYAKKHGVVLEVGGPSYYR